MPVELKVPSVGESITEVQLGQALKKEGDTAAKDQGLIEIETDKVTLELPAPIAGKVSKWLKKQGDKAAVGEVIGYMEEAGAASTAAPAAPAPAAPGSAAAKSSDAKGHVMPAAARAAATAGIDPATVEGSGPGGRVLKEDVQKAASSSPAPGTPAAPAPAKSAEPARSGSPVNPNLDADRAEEIVPMTPLRRRIAERLVEAQHNAAMLTTFNEVDMSAVMALRAQYKDVFAEKYKTKLGFMSFFVKAAIHSLKLVPQVNAQIRGTDIVYFNYYDIGVAIGGGKGLVVPILRNAERLSFAQIETKIGDLAKRAQDNKLELKELQGGTFTISNGGVYGSLLSTPIINPPQSAILGLHAITDRPVVRDKQIVIRPMMNLALSYDHRIIDGREAVTFLKALKDAVEDPTRMLVEV
jgi:2-oxoglutarate dehydrogenase E2 component (dihydrolipoamide succinyltransferase)